MTKLHEIYLNRLKLRLNKKIPTQVTEEHMREIASHINECNRDLINQGKSPIEAEVEALKRVGSDALVADAFIRSYHRLAKASSWRAARFPVVCLLLLAVLQMIVRVIGSPSILPTSILGVLLILAAASFAIACYKYRRFLLTPMIVTLIFYAVASNIIDFAFGPAGMTPYAAKNRQIAYLRYNDAALEVQAKQHSFANFLRHPQVMPSWMKATAPVIFRETHDPSDPVAWDPHLVKVPDEKTARRMWAQNGDTYLQFLESKTNWTHPPARLYTFDHPEAMVSSVAISLLATIRSVVFLAILNALALAAAHLRLQVLKRTWHPYPLT